MSDETEGCGKKCNCPSKREHWLSIGVSAKAMPTRGGPSVAATEATERNVTENRDAYKRLKADGLQPASLMEAKHIERTARTELEVTSGQKFKDLSMANDAAALMRETAAK